MKDSSFAILIVLGTLSALLGLILLQDFVGMANYDFARSGTISEIRLERQESASLWNGIYGLVIMFPAINNTWSVMATNAGMNQIVMLVPCLPGDTTIAEVFASNATTDQIDWGNLRPAPLDYVDSFLKVDPNYTAMTASRTFGGTMSITLGTEVIDGIPMVHTYQKDVPGSTVFRHGLLWDGRNIVVAAQVTQAYPVGFDGNLYNYQMFVPVPDNSTLRYYLMTDPYDTCPGGEDEGYGRGVVEGYIRDNTTGTLLGGVEVYVGRSSAVSDSAGYYNMSVQEGTYKIFALRYGYNNYIENITIESGNTTVHNISMQLYVEEQSGSGSGVGTGVGPGRTTRTKKNVDIGPGFGPGIGPYLEKPEDLGIDHYISLDKLIKKLRIGNFFTELITIYNFRKEAADVEIELRGNATEILQLDKTSLTIEPGASVNFTVTGFGLELGEFAGEIAFSGDFNDTIPVRITVTDEDKLPVEALMIDLQMLTSRMYAGDNVKLRLNMHNMLIEEVYDVYLYYTIQGIDNQTSNFSIELEPDTVQILTTASLIKEFQIPKDWPKGEYMLSVEAEYLDLYSKTSTIIVVSEPLYKYKLFGILPLWQLLAGLSTLFILVFTFIVIKAKMDAKKRFHAKVEHNLLPKKGARSLYMGKLAETETDTYFDMDALTVHTIVAGSTGGGKSISGQDLVEEALMKGVAVVVFDPTAQWSGMLRKCVDPKMLSFYPRFHMTGKDARAFSGNVRAIKNPREKIDLMKYFKPGEIQIFTLSTLDPKGIDLFVANTVREIFHSNLQEYRGLRMLMVYDEVHRLLPKFGGSGEGFIQIERACREFRKWGIGVLLISQVLADFVGQIKANINTEIQMKTRDEGDLQRIETKYGKSYVQELVKAPVGSGMVQNSGWNRGKPYYISFRPIMHSVQRLSDEELAQYNKYNEIVDDLAYQIDQLEKEGTDVFDLRLELKLSLDKIKTGSFNMVDIYLEGLKPRLEKIWKELGKTPLKKEIELISEEALQADLDAAKKQKEELEKKDKKEDGGEKKDAALGYKDDVPPNMLLNLSNGMIVINMKGLYDELLPMKEEDYRQHVNEQKNDFAGWIREACKNPKLADVAERILEKQEFLDFLLAVEKGQGEKFVVKKPRKVEPKKEEPKKEEPKKEEPKKEEPKKEEPKKEEPTHTDPPKAEPQQQVVPVEQPALAAVPPVEQLAPTAVPPVEQPAPDARPAPPAEPVPSDPAHKQYPPVPDDKVFRLADGRLLRTPADLRYALLTIDDSIFRSHVDDVKNDFAAWIRGVFQDEDLASRIQKAGKDDMIKEIEKVI